VRGSPFEFCFVPFRGEGFEELSPPRVSGSEPAPSPVHFARIFDAGPPLPTDRVNKMGVAVSKLQHRLSEPSSISTSCP
jgi:hypothetical protein